MKRFTRILALALALSMALALAACGDSGAKPSGGTPAGTPASTPPENTGAPSRPAGDTSGQDFGEYSAGNPLQIKLSHFGNEQDQLNLLSESFKEKVEAASGGAVEVTIYSGGVLGNDRESFESVINGTLEMAVNNTPIISNYVDKFQVLDLGYLFQDYDHVDAFLASEICQELMDSLTPTGARMLCMQCVGWRNMDMIGGPVAKPADIAGTKIRVTDSPIYMADFEAWGANPTIIAAPEVITALQQKTIDGCDNVHNIQYSNGYSEFCRYVSITEHACHFNGLTINDVLFTSLTPDLQNVIKQAAMDAAAERTLALRTENDGLLLQMEQEGCTITRDVDKQAFIDLLQPVYEDFIANHSAGSYVARIQALQ